MIERGVHMTKRRNPSGKIGHTGRGLQDGRARGEACGPRRIRSTSVDAKSGRNDTLRS